MMLQELLLWIQSVMLWAAPLALFFMLYVFSFWHIATVESIPN